MTKLGVSLITSNRNIRRVFPDGCLGDQAVASCCCWACSFTLTNSGEGASDVYRLNVTGGQVASALVALKAGGSQTVAVTSRGRTTLAAVSESDPGVKANDSCGN